MNANQKGSSAKSEQISVLQYHGSNVVFQEINGKMMVNATQMAKPFGQKPVKWLRTEQAQSLIQTIAKVLKWSLADLQVVKKGGSNSGTWFHEDVALMFAQWLSPEFYLACNTKLKELLSQQALNLPSKYGVYPIIHDGKLYYSYTEALRALGASTRGSTSRRKNKHPHHFVMLYGRNFITAEYFDLLYAYYAYKNMSNQFKLAL